MRLSVFIPTNSPQLITDLQKIYQNYLHQEALTERALTQIINHSDTLFFVTLFNERHLGAVNVSFSQKTAQLHQLCIRTITRRRGVGRNLLREVEKHLKQKQINTIQLSLDEISKEEQPELIQFMIACGYKLVQQTLTKSLL